MQHRDYRWLWLLLMAATVGFIWQQSTLAPADSSATSDAVGEVIVPIVGGPTSPLGAFFDRFLRKIAHFTEFAVLGAESECYLALRHTPQRTALQILFGGFVAAADEFLQLFTGRGAAFADVLLDVCGFVIALFFLRVCFFLVHLRHCRRKEKNKI